MNILGIDPGLSGACAFYDGQDLGLWPLPTMKAKKGRDLDISAIGTWMDRAEFHFHFDHAFIETQGFRPVEGKNAILKNGYGWGALVGIVAANFIPRTAVAPQTWKRALRLTGGKDESIARAHELFPREATIIGHHDGKAEAALIAYYGWLQMPREAAA